MQNSVIDVLIYIGYSAAIIVAGYVVGRLTRFLLNLLLSRIGFNDWVKKLSIGKAIIRAGLTPVEFFSSLAAWIIYISFILLAIGFGSREISSALGGVSHLTDLSNVSYELLTIYVAGFVKAFVVIVIGFILVDGFIGYIYSVSGSREETVILAPVAEYLRILFYIVTLTFALSVSGVRVGELIMILQPIVWGITAIMVAISIAIIVSRVFKR